VIWTVVNWSVVIWTVEFWTVVFWIVVFSTVVFWIVVFSTVDPLSSGRNKKLQFKSIWFQLKVFLSHNIQYS
jgi:hypothetical protein